MKPVAVSRDWLLLSQLKVIFQLETARNRDLANGSYESKRAIYAQSDFQITRAVAEHYSDWNEAKIESRQKQLAKMATGIWRLDFGV